MEGSGWEGQNSALRVVEPYKEEEKLFLHQQGIYAPKENYQNYN